MNIVSTLELLALTIKAETGLNEEDTVIYVGKRVYEAIYLELSKVQRMPEKSKHHSKTKEIVIMGMLLIRPEHELTFLEQAIHEIRRIVA